MCWQHRFSAWKVVIMIMLTAAPDFQFHCAPAWECSAFFCLIVKKIPNIYSPNSSSILKSYHNYQPTDPDLTKSLTHTDSNTRIEKHDSRQILDLDLLKRVLTVTL